MRTAVSPSSEPKPKPEQEYDTKGGEISSASVSSAVTLEDPDYFMLEVMRPEPPLIQLDSITPQCPAVRERHRKFASGDSVGDRCQRWRGWLRPVAQRSRHGSAAPSSDKFSIVGMFAKYCIRQYLHVLSFH